MEETLMLNRSLDPFLEDYIELNDLNEPFELRRNQGDELIPTIEEGEVIEEFRTKDKDLDTGIDDYPRFEFALAKLFPGYFQCGVVLGTLGGCGRGLVGMCGWRMRVVGLEQSGGTWESVDGGDGQVGGGGWAGGSTAGDRLDGIRDVWGCAWRRRGLEGRVERGRRAWGI
ncbi:hypothetical protein Tco_1137755, partial [Tanacetum coccineum]